MPIVPNPTNNNPVQSPTTVDPPAAGGIPQGEGERQATVTETALQVLKAAPQYGVAATKTLLLYSVRSLAFICRIGVGSARVIIGVAGVISAGAHAAAITLNEGAVAADSLGNMIEPEAPAPQGAGVRPDQRA